MHRRYFRSCIKRILDDLTKADFTHELFRSPGLENKKSGKSKKKKKSTSKKSQRSYRPNKSTESPQSTATVDEVLQEKKEIAKEYMVINNRNWGKMSPTMLATITQDRDIIAHDLCWKVICKIWRNGKIRQQVCPV